MPDICVMFASNGNNIIQIRPLCVKEGQWTLHNARDENLLLHLAAKDSTKIPPTFRSLGGLSTAHADTLFPFCASSPKSRDQMLCEQNYQVRTGRGVSQAILQCLSAYCTSACAILLSKSVRIISSCNLCLWMALLPLFYPFSHRTGAGLVA